MSKKYSKANLRHIAEDMMEGLRECADGTFTNTGTLAHDYGYDDMKTFEIFKLHKALFRTALANNITLRTFKDDGKMVGLPFNLTFVVRNKGAQIKCPHCGSNDTARYIYGYPALSEEMQRIRRVRIADSQLIDLSLESFIFLVRKTDRLFPYLGV